MDRTFWHKQTAGKPLYPDMLWSRPENKAHAGKLTIIGGNLHGFATAAEAYAEAEKAGVGVARVLLPNSLQKTVGRIFAAGEYAPSTPSGSFSQQALGEALNLAQWGDGVLLAGDLGRNSETALFFESFIATYTGTVVISGDAVDYAIPLHERILSREQTTVVVDFNQLQKIATASHSPIAFTSNMGILQFAEVLHEFSLGHEANFVVMHQGSICVASGGDVTTTRDESETIHLTPIAARIAVWALQNPQKTLEAMTTAIYELLS